MFNLLPLLVLVPLLGETTINGKHFFKLKLRLTHLITHHTILTLTLVEDIEIGDLDQQNIDQDDEDYYLELEIRESIC